MPPEEKEKYESIFEQDWFEYSLFDDIYKYLCDYGLEAIGDLTRISSWGVVTDDDGEERLVLIDYGLTDDIFDNYYRRR